MSNSKFSKLGKTNSSAGIKSPDVKRKSSKLHAFSYIGGKYFLIPFLIAMIPIHAVYVEVFGGSGAFLLNKPVSKVEIYNDINSNVVNFFRVLREQPKELTSLLAKTPHARDEFSHSKRNIDHTGDPVEKARMYFVKAQQSFRGRGNDWAVGLTTNTANTFSNKVNTLQLVSDRLKKVSIDNRDYKYIFKHYLQKENVFAYLDPPYVHSTRTTKNDYAYEMTDADHVELLKLANDSPAKILISGYDNALYREHLKGWRRKRINVSCHSAYSPNLKEKPRRTEVLWYNYDLKS